MLNGRVRGSAILGAIACILVLAGTASARPVMAMWDPNNDLHTAGYRLYYGTSSGSFEVEIDVGNVTNYPVDLRPGRTYYFRLRAYNASGQLGPPSEEASISLPNQRPVLHTPGDIIVPSGPVAGQLTASDPDGDPLTFAIQGLPASVVLDQSTGVVSGAIGAGVYTVTISATDGTEQAQHTFRLTVVGPACAGAPSRPTLQPATVSGSMVTLAWSAAGGAAPSSFVILAGSAAGQSKLARFDTGSTSAALTTPAPDGVYFVRVVARNACGDSPASNEITVTVGTGPPGAPRNLAFTRSGVNVTLTWSAPLGAAAPTGYVVEAGSASGLSNLGVIPTGSTSTTLSGAAPPGTYYVRVKALNAAGAGPASNQVVITVP
jgi:titin